MRLVRSAVGSGQLGNLGARLLADGANQIGKHVSADPSIDRDAGVFPQLRFLQINSEVVALAEIDCAGFLELSAFALGSLALALDDFRTLADQLSLVADRRSDFLGR
ncbi:MAG TPA: hypothetical protein VEH04_11375 [Verrucomicrobiae bacterium]|nr:hypothetical protein [Verrucomicrobiae bacterium]